MPYIENPVAEEFVLNAEEEHRHSGDRIGHILGRGEAGHLVGEQPHRQRRRERRVWNGLGRLNPVNKNEGMYRA